MAVCIAGMAAWALPCRAINIVVDYTYDTSKFFGAGNPEGQGAAAKSSIEAAASFFSSILDDTFSAISTPPDYFGAAGAFGHWEWTLSFTHPATGAQVALKNQTIPQNVYRLYVGGRNLGGSNLGIGGTSTPGFGYNYRGPYTSPSEQALLSQTTLNFVDAVTNRGQPIGFASWGGYITFDHDAGTAWHFDHNTLPAPGENDFYSVALHEMAHSLGFGSSSQWNDLATGSHFSGQAATAAYGGPPPLQATSPSNPTPTHWLAGTMSRVLGTNVVQEAAMDPELTVGTRKLFTTLDAAALTDIGWTVDAPPPTFNAADFNHDGLVNAGDLGVWRSAFKKNANADVDGDGDSDGKDFVLWQRRMGAMGATAGTIGIPEPAGIALAMACLLLLTRRRFR